MPVPDEPAQPNERISPEVYNLHDLSRLLDLPSKRVLRLFGERPGVIRETPPGYKHPGLIVPVAILLAVLQESAVKERGNPLLDWNRWLENPSRLHRIPDLGSGLRLGETRARRLFEHEPGTLHFSAPGDQRPAIRVPDEVVQRVLRCSSVPEKPPDRQM
jgi:hypothetical protein